MSNILTRVYTLFFRKVRSPNALLLVNAIAELPFGFASGLIGID